MMLKSVFVIYEENTNEGIHFICSHRTNVEAMLLYTNYALTMSSLL